jgi:hypothetical protein
MFLKFFLSDSTVIRLSLCKEKITLAVSAIFLHFKSLEKKKIWVGTIIFLVSVSYPYRTVFIWIGSRVLMTKNKKQFSAGKILFFWDQKQHFAYPLASTKDLKASEEAFNLLKRTSSSSKHEIS